MLKLSLFLGLIASVIPSLAAPTPSVPFYKSDGPVKYGSFIVKVRNGSVQTGVMGLLTSLPGANTVTDKWDADFYNAFAGLWI